MRADLEVQEKWRDNKAVRAGEYQCGANVNDIRSDVGDTEMRVRLDWIDVFHVG